MTDETSVTIALIGACASGFASLCTVGVSLYTHSRIRELEVNTNSIKDELVRVTGESERAKGVIQGAEQEASKKREEG
jgi:hypothetical protein